MSIHDMTHKAFIAEILSGGVSLHDIETRCKGDAHETDAVFASLLEEQARLQRPANYTPVIAWDGVWHGDDTKWNENPWYQDPNTGEWKRIINYPELARVEDAIIFVQSLMDAATEDTDNAKADAPEPLQGIEDCILCKDKQSAIDKLRNLLQGKKGAFAARHIYAAELLNIMAKPKWGILQSGLGIVGSEQGFNQRYKEAVAKYREFKKKGITDENKSIVPKVEHAKETMQNLFQDCPTKG